MERTPRPTYRLAELAGGLSLAGDAADGFPEGKAIRTAALAVTLGRLVGVTDVELRAAYFTTLARFLGCTGFAIEEAHLYGAGDDVTVRNVMAMADAAQPLRTVATITSSIGRGAAIGPRARAVARLLATPTAVLDHARAQCDTTLAVAHAFGIEGDALACVGAIMERWDGKGAPRKLRREALPIPVRLLHAADVLETIWHRHDFDAALAELRRRRDHHLSPAVVDVALRNASELRALLDAGRDWEWFLESEPQPRAIIDDARFERVAETVGRLVDLKSTYTLGHSARVAELARALLVAVGGSEGDARVLAIAAHLHDLGRMGVPNSIWDKPGPLSRLERERAESHSALTERILRRSPALERFAPIAGAAHERVDGRGYHRRLAPAAVERAMRVLAVADVATALAEPRAHRPALRTEDVPRVLRDECAGLDRGLVDAALDLAAAKPRDGRRSSGRWPNGLTDREIEVLRATASGKTNAETGIILGISARTVQNHLANAYAKLGVESRGGAALFMMEHGLLV